MEVSTKNWSSDPAIQFPKKSIKRVIGFTNSVRQRGRSSDFGLNFNIFFISFIEINNWSLDVKNTLRYGKIPW